MQHVHFASLGKSTLLKHQKQQKIVPISNILICLLYRRYWRYQKINRFKSRTFWDTSSHLKHFPITINSVCPHANRIPSSRDPSGFLFSSLSYSAFSRGSLHSSSLFDSDGFRLVWMGSDRFGLVRTGSDWVWMGHRYRVTDCSSRLVLIVVETLEKNVHRPSTCQQHSFS